MQFRQIRDCFRAGFNVSLGHDFHQRNSGAVVIHAGACSALFVHEFAGVLFEMYL